MYMFAFSMHFVSSMIFLKSWVLFLVVYHVVCSVECYDGHGSFFPSMVDLISTVIESDNNIGRSLSQVEKAYREGTSLQSAHSLFICLAMNLLEDRVHVACKEILTLENQVCILITSFDMNDCI